MAKADRSAQSAMSRASGPTLEIQMHNPLTFSRHSAVIAALLLAVAATGCSNMSQRDKNTAVGAGVGAAAGAILTGGGTLGTLGGAAVGGVIGNQVDKKK
jgi:osmotically inducible lipoprotein OsmB